MRIKDLQISQVKVGLQVYGLVTGKLGVVVQVDEKDDDYAWIKWEDEARYHSLGGFYWNHCECKIVEDKDGNPIYLTEQEMRDKGYFENGRFPSK